MGRAWSQPVPVLAQGAEAGRHPIATAIHDVAVRRIPGEEGIWVVVFGDLMMFGLFFLTFMYYRSQNLPLYRSGRLAMAQGLGIANTILLLTSSWLVARAVAKIREDNAREAPPLLAFALLCGSFFVAVKAIEWGTKFAHGISLLTNDYFMFYFMFTGIHLLHVLIGIAVLSALFAKARRNTWSARSIALLESGAIFWHLVDLLWIVLFALFYVIR